MDNESIKVEISDNHFTASAIGSADDHIWDGRIPSREEMLVSCLEECLRAISRRFIRMPKLVADLVCAMYDSKYSGIADLGEVDEAEIRLREAAEHVQMAYQKLDARKAIERLECANGEE